MTSNNQSIALFSTKDGADKTYEIYLEEVDGGFILTGFNGRRGGALKKQEKIIAPVPYEVALKAYGDLIKEKEKKGGYRPSGGDCDGYTASVAGTPSGIDLHHLTQVSEDEIEKYLTDDSFLAEQKYDGERRPVAKRNVVIGGNKNGFQVPLVKNIANIIATLPDNTELDAEQVGDKLYVFDALMRSGVSLRGTPCIDRMVIAKKLIENLGVQSDVVAVDVAIGTASKRAMYKLLREQKKEGIVFKRINSKYGIGKNDDLIKVKFCESATVQVVEKHPTKRSVLVRVFNEYELPISMGYVTIPEKYKIPADGEIIEVKYLYAIKKLIQAVYIGIRTDQTVAACVTSQLKYKEKIDEDDETVNL